MTSDYSHAYLIILTDGKSERILATLFDREAASSEKDRIAAKVGQGGLVRVEGRKYRLDPDGSF